MPRNCEYSLSVYKYDTEMPFNDFHTFFLNVAAVMFRTHAQNLLSSTEVETRAFSLRSGKNTTLPAPPPALHTWTLETTRKNEPKQRVYLEQTIFPWENNKNQV